VLTDSGDESCEYIEAWELERLCPCPTVKEASFRASSKEKWGGVVGPKEKE
jgi:hypothetical protein